MNHEENGAAVRAGLLCALGIAAGLLETAGGRERPVCAGRPGGVVHGIDRGGAAVAAGPAVRCSGGAA